VASIAQSDGDVLADETGSTKEKGLGLGHIYLSV
jgi:hypothetical protein